PRRRHRPGEPPVPAGTTDAPWAVRPPGGAVRVWGTGDAFAALFLGVYLDRRDPPAALEHAVAALDQVLAVAEAENTDELPLALAQDAVVNPRSRFTAERLA